MKERAFLLPIRLAPARGDKAGIIYFKFPNKSDGQTNDRHHLCIKRIKFNIYINSSNRAYLTWNPNKDIYFNHCL